MQINVGDDITISGTVLEVYEHSILIETRQGNSYCIDVADIKTIRPYGNGGKRNVIDKV